MRQRARRGGGQRPQEAHPSGRGHGLGQAVVGRDRRDQVDDGARAHRAQRGRRRGHRVQQVGDQQRRRSGQQARAFRHDGGQFGQTVRAQSAQRLERAERVDDFAERARRQRTEHGREQRADAVEEVDFRFHRYAVRRGYRFQQSAQRFHRDLSQKRRHAHQCAEQMTDVRRRQRVQRDEIFAEKVHKPSDRKRRY